MKRLTSFSLALTTLVGAAGASMAAGLQLNPSFIPAAQRQADLNKNRLADNLEARLTETPAGVAVPVIVSYKAGQRPAQVAFERAIRPLLDRDRGRPVGYDTHGRPGLRGNDPETPDMRLQRGRRCVKANLGAIDDGAADAHRGASMTSAGPDWQ